ncbi:hypothetical protein OPIT5_22330 [Opitutaceae bacterium TAV5]|nr:hypothetical protein OPIT5_22330 [Opitutaceae bacterium TAV5]
MSLTGELSKLAALRQSGTRTETEFQQAKAKLLEPSYDPSTSKMLDTLRRGQNPRENFLGEAANCCVSFQIVMAVVGHLILFLLRANHMPLKPPLRRKHDPASISPHSPWQTSIHRPDPVELST